MNTRKLYVLILIVVMMPEAVFGQDPFAELQEFHEVLRRLYEEMMPLCANLIGVGRGIAGFAALWFISSRIWKHLSAAEPIDFYPLFRPFVIGFCISIFPSVLGLINGVLSPVVSATSSMVTGSNQAITELLKRKQEAIKQTDLYQMYIGDDGMGNRERWYRYTHQDAEPQSEGFFEGIGNDVKFAMSRSAYMFRTSVKECMSELLSVIFLAAALCIDTLRTFQLVVLSILGPLVFGLAVFDGFQHTLVIWLARYINVFLWLPVANIFGSMIGKIQENMLKIDLAQIEGAGDTFFSRTDLAYLIFLLIGIVGYFAVPSIANYIVNSSENGAFVRSVTNIFIGSATKLPTRMSVGATMTADAMGDQAGRMSKSMAESSHTEPYFNDVKSPDQYMNDKLRGNP